MASSFHVLKTNTVSQAYSRSSAKGRAALWSLGPYAQKQSYDLLKVLPQEFF